MARAKKVSRKPESRKLSSKSGAKPSAKSKAGKRPPKLTSGKTTAKSAKAMRLTFSYDGDRVKLISQQPVDMIVPPSDPVKRYEKQKGFWAELKSDQDKTLYRRVMHNPTRNDAEVFSDDAEQSISREPAPKRKGVFVVVVPDSKQAREVTLFRSSPEVRGPTHGIQALASKPAKEILRFKLKK